MRTHQPTSPYRLATIPRAAAAAALALFAALALACGGDGADTRTVASDRTADSPEARQEPPPVSRNDRAGTLEARAGGRDSADPDVEEASVGPASVPEEVTYAQAESVYHSGDYRRAVRFFEAYLDREPEHPWGLYMLGLSARKAERPERAEKAFRNVLEIDPDHVKSRVNLARTLLDLDRPGEAVETLRPVLRSSGPPADALRVAGNAVWQEGDRERARRLYRAAISTDGGDAWSMNNLGLTLIREGRYEEALAPLARALELAGDRAPIRNNLGIALERTGHPGLAAEHYRAAVDEGHPTAGGSLARVESRATKADGPGLDLTVLAHDFAVKAESWSADLALEVPQDADPDPSPEGDDPR